MRVVQTIADAFADNPYDPLDMAENASIDLGYDYPWLLPLAKRTFQQLNTLDAYDVQTIRMVIDADKKFSKQIREKKKRRPDSEHELNTAKRPILRRWPKLPVVQTTGQLAKLLKTDWRVLQQLYRNRHNYRRTWIRKRSSGHRLVEAPCPQLKLVQRRILETILNQIPIHNDSHGFCRNRNAVSFASSHTGRACLLKFDLQDFFPTIRFGRVQGLFQLAGYGKSVSRLLAQLCTTICPREVVELKQDESAPEVIQLLRRLYLPAHLPQGAPTSPMLANQCAYRLDCRLSGFAKTMGANYSRYADDLLFSGGKELARRFPWFASIVGAVVLEEGFQLNYRKSRLMTAANRQLAAGIVLNHHTNLRRDEFDRLKATLYNCIQHGPCSQNRDQHADFRAHLAGKVNWVMQLNEPRGKKLQKLFVQIQWPQATSSPIEH